MESIKVLAIAPLLLAMYGCSSSSDSAAPTTPTTPTTLSGLFLDAEVEGLSYTTSSGGSGTTDANGTYTYKSGDTITFKVGGVNLGTVDGAPKCTPFDFAAAATNIARFLQSLDADDDPTNGIDIVAANTALAGTSISSDAFLADDATFEANADIAAALSTTADTLIDKATAIANLDAGTDTTFDAAELSDKVFVVIDSASPLELGILSFDADFTASSIWPEDTTDGGGDGSSFDETWAVGTDGVLTLTSTGSTTTVNRIGGSSRSISVTYSEDGAAAKAATLLIPQPMSYDHLAGVNIGDSKTYDVIDSDGTQLSVVLTRAEASLITYKISDTDTGTFTIGDDDIVTITDDGDTTALTFMALLDGSSSVIGDKATVLFVGTTMVGGDINNPDLEFNNLGVGSLTLTAITPAP